jgi:hypothetical protein
MYCISFKLNNNSYFKNDLDTMQNNEKMDKEKIENEMKNEEKENEMDNEKINKLKRKIDDNNNSNNDTKILKK